MRAKLDAPDRVGDDRFGSSVSIHGDNAIVGARWDDNEIGEDAGSVYFFSRDKGGKNNWGFVKKRISPRGARDDYLGKSVFIYGDYAVAGAPFDNTTDGLYSRGTVYIFQQNYKGMDKWGITRTLTNLESSDGYGGLGRSVYISGDYAIAGADSIDAAYIFKVSQAAN